MGAGSYIYSQTMSLLHALSSREMWERFYEYKISLVSRGSFEKELRMFIDREAYLPLCRKYGWVTGTPDYARDDTGRPARTETAGVAAGEIAQTEALVDHARKTEQTEAEEKDRLAKFPLPRRAVISKLDSAKKRIVYTYPEPENTVLKMLTWLLLRKYDPLFSDNLFSFRPGRSAKDAIRLLRSVPDIRNAYSYKADISNYFNSIPVEKLIPMLEETLGDDPELLSFLRGLLEEPLVLESGKGTAGWRRDPGGDPGAASSAEPKGIRTIREEKGIMAGTPLSAFYANLYLRDLDLSFAKAGVPYARYSDDMILFAESREEAERHAEMLRAFLDEKGLKLNPEKEEYRTPEEGWVFLGFSYRDGIIDIAPASIRKIKAKMRRKARALRRWADRNGVEPERAAAAFIRVFNRKLLGPGPDTDLTWSRWFFPVINTTDSLAEIDHYAQECIRYLVSGTRTKARYNVRYEDIRALGFRSLVHAYYEGRNAEDCVRSGYEETNSTDTL